MSHEAPEKPPVLMTLSDADLEALAALEAAHGWVTAGSAARLAASLRAPGTLVFGLVADDAVVGYAAMDRQPFEAELQAVLVDTRWRGRGLARRLLAEVVEQARAWGSERLLLEVRVGNASAIALYRGAGFEDDGIRRGYYPPRQAGAVREDALLMSLALE
ncbi:GNAT family N-acetyltransferase [Halomonas halodenitrificans]|uniref:GNAT family N-acetyltransferase n=1 Tax=Halomonas halodenitrificans TaxID=28252 RepID=UPI000B25F63F|nr:GNAT family N-acetyltransferase [Halomonas halodenitrificans]